MSIMGKIFSVLGFEGNDEEKKPKSRKEKKVKAKFNLKKKDKFQRKDNIDGIKVLYPEDFSDAEKILEYLKADETIIFSIELCEKVDVYKIVAYLSGASKMIGGKIALLEKDKYYIFLPEGVEIEQA